MAPQTRLPMAGYRALDLTDEKGFLCGTMLAYLGVEVVKVEQPGGDPPRSRGPFAGDVPHPERSLYWMAANPGKKSITLNLKSDTGRVLFRRLVEEFNFVIESFPPGYLVNLGLGYTDLERINPDIIVTSITPFGSSGPYRDFKTSDLVSLSMGGLLYVTGEPARPPVRLGGEQAYVQAGLHAAAATLTAHHYRARTGKGQHVDVSICESVFRASYNLVPLWDLSRQLDRRLGNRVFRSGIYQREVWRCKDGFVVWRFFAGQWGKKEWNALIDWMDETGKAGELKGVDFERETTADISQDRIDRWEGQIAEFFSGLTRAQIQEQAIKRGLRLLQVNTPIDVLENRHFAARGYWKHFYYPEVNADIPHPAHLYLSTEGTPALSRRSPSIGEHNDEIYRRELGYTKKEMTMLREMGAI